MPAEGMRCRAIRPQPGPTCHLQMRVSVRMHLKCSLPNQSTVSSAVDGAMI